MGKITVQGKTVEVDENGFLAHVDDWNKNVADYFAQAEGITMSDKHWEVVNFLREYYQECRIAPVKKILVRALERKFGPEKGNENYIYELFPAGPAKQACKIAGLPRPAGCL